VHGDFDSQTARQLNFQLLRCTGRADCKSEEEILDYFRGKYLIFCTNQIRFDSSKYNAEAIVKESRFSWLRMNTSVRETIPFKIQSTQLNLKDNFFDIDELTEHEASSVFKLEQMPK